MRISDWSSDVCSSDLPLDKYLADLRKGFELTRRLVKPLQVKKTIATLSSGTTEQITFLFKDVCGEALSVAAGPFKKGGEAISAFVEAQALLYVLNRNDAAGRSEEHTSELQSLMRISYAVFCLKKKKQITIRSDVQTRC